jgi:hypothetical protein
MPSFKSLASIESSNSPLYLGKNISEECREKDL